MGEHCSIGWNAFHVQVIWLLIPPLSTGSEILEVLICMLCALNIRECNGALFSGYLKDQANGVVWQFVGTMIAYILNDEYIVLRNVLG